MNSIQNTACLIAAYETAAGLPDNERITRTDGTWRPGVTEQQAASLYRQAQALLAPETKLLSTSRESLIDRCGRFAVQGAVRGRHGALCRHRTLWRSWRLCPPWRRHPSPLTRNAKTCSVQGRFFPDGRCSPSLCIGAV